MANRKLIFLLCLTVALLTVTPAFGEDAAALFKSKCAMCHGPNGAGDTPVAKKQNIRDLRSADVQKQSDADLTAMIGEGGKDKEKKPTHAYAKKGMSADDIKALVAYVRGLATK